VLCVVCCVLCVVCCVLCVLCVLCVGNTCSPAPGVPVKLSFCLCVICVGHRSEAEERKILFSIFGQQTVVSSRCVGCVEHDQGRVCAGLQARCYSFPLSRVFFVGVCLGNLGVGGRAAPILLPDAEQALYLELFEAIW
jgi:hypothetical protein